MKSKFFTGIATLTGTIIGAGFLGIPYVVAKSGFLIGLFWMFLICVMMLLINLMMGEIILSTKTMHHIPGYASKYLGRKTKFFVFIASIIGLYAALVAYLIGEGDSISFLIFGTTRFSLYTSLGFWVLMSIITFRGIRSFKKIEPLAVIIVFLVTLILGIVNFDKLNFSNLNYSNPSYLFLPFGVILFAFLGVSSIPEIKRVLKNNEKLMKKAIIIGSFIPLIIYVLFTIIVLGLYGQEVSEIATISFGRIITLLGMLTMFTAFFALNLALQDTYRFDFKFSFKKAWIFSSIFPLIFFLIIKFWNLGGFSKVLSWGGSISGGLLGISILLIHEHLQDKKRERKPEIKIYIPLILKILFILIFISGILYEFL
ncbi:MAG: aromatic amino acid transport family protein [Nanoarchaeota archaeon]|nr:amino acid permease [Nanoarchaeota archaeon]